MRTVRTPRKLSRKKTQPGQVSTPAAGMVRPAMRRVLRSLAAILPLARRLTRGFRKSNQTKCARDGSRCPSVQAPLARSLTHAIINNWDAFGASISRANATATRSAVQHWRKRTSPGWGVPWMAWSAVLPCVCKARQCLSELYGRI